MSSNDAAFTISRHDEWPEDVWRIVDDGLEQANQSAAPLHEVSQLSCFARDAAGRVVGGALGRRWGVCAELQQLWVDPALRRRGLGRSLIEAFETAAAAHGCRSFYLETFSFQAPSLYRAAGYRVVGELAVYPHGIVKYTMLHETAEGAPIER